MSQKTQARELFEKVKSVFTEKLTHKTVFKFVETSMEVIELNDELSGEQKKSLVIESLTIALTEIVPDEQDYELLTQFIEFFVESTIDEIIEINKGNLKLNPKKSVFFRCFTFCKNIGS
jgi:hypothetical protein